MKDLKEVGEGPDRCIDIFIYPATTEAVVGNEDAIRRSNIIKVRVKVVLYLVDVQEAREQAIATLNQKMAEGLDAENAQDNDDCNQLPPEIHPDYETQHPDCFLERSKQPSKSTSSSYKKITQQKEKCEKIINVNVKVLKYIWLILEITIFNQFYRWRMNSIHRTKKISYIVAMNATIHLLKLQM